MYPSGFFAQAPAPGQKRKFPTGNSALPPPPPPPPPTSSTYQYANQNFHFPQRGYHVQYQHSQHLNYGTVPPLSQPYASYQQHPQYSSHNIHHVSNPHIPRQPENPRHSFCCEPCKIEFDSQSALNAHLTSHIKCTACDFSAAPKIVKAHYQASHGKFSGSGFKNITVAIPGCPVQRFRICVGNRPEDIQKWITDRKRKFPRRNKSKMSAIDLESGKNAAAEPSTSNLLDGYGSSSSEREETNDCRGNETIDDRSQTKPATVNGGQQSNASSNYRTKVCRYFARTGTCRNGDQCTYSHDLSSLPRHNNSSDNPRQRKRAKRAPATLLEKLLVNDSKRETILTLQILNHIVETNFLDSGRS